MVMIGDVHPDIQKLVRTTRFAMNKAILACGPGVPYKEIGNKIQNTAEQNGFKVCPFFTGHGIGM